MICDGIHKIKFLVLRVQLSFYRYYLGSINKFVLYKEASNKLNKVQCITLKKKTWVNGYIQITPMKAAICSASLICFF